jgi:hypothetical protein
MKHLFQSIEKNTLVAFVRSRLKKKSNSSTRHKNRFMINSDKSMKASAQHINTEGLNIRDKKNTDLDFQQSNHYGSPRLFASRKKRVPPFVGPYQVVTIGNDTCIVITIGGVDMPFCESEYDISNYI